MIKSQAHIICEKNVKRQKTQKKYTKVLELIKLDKPSKNHET